MELKIIYDKNIRSEKNYSCDLARFGERLTLEQLISKCQEITKDKSTIEYRVVVDELNGIVIDTKQGNSEYLLNDYELFRRKVVKLFMISSTVYEDGTFFVQMLVRCE